MEQARFGKLKLVCECSGKAIKEAISWKGIKARAWKCPKCKEEPIHPMDAKRALEIARKNPMEC